MIPRPALDCVDRLLRDITGCGVAFGAKVILLGGDFRQIRPVLSRGSEADVVANTILQHPMMQDGTFRRFTLTRNMRLVGEGEARNRTETGCWSWAKGERRKPLSSIPWPRRCRRTCACRKEAQARLFWIGPTQTCRHAHRNACRLEAKRARQTPGSVSELYWRPETVRPMH